jgi:hypothetical protein
MTLRPQNEQSNESIEEIKGVPVSGELVKALAIP